MARKTFQSGTQSIYTVHPKPANRHAVSTRQPRSQALRSCGRKSLRTSLRTFRLLSNRKIWNKLEVSEMNMTGTLYMLQHHTISTHWYIQPIARTQNDWTGKIIRYAETDFRNLIASFLSNVLVQKNIREFKLEFDVTNINDQPRYASYGGLPWLSKITSANNNGVKQKIKHMTTAKHDIACFLSRRKTFFLFLLSSTASSLGFTSEPTNLFMTRYILV
jgi:hypothetical protein